MLPLYADGAFMKNIGLHFKSVNRVVKNSKRCCWTKNLGDGYRLIQDVDGRLVTLFPDADSFLKSSCKVGNSHESLLRQWR